MRQRQGVEHILTDRLENQYSRTLCGRIVHFLGPIFRTYPDPRYFQDNHPDCQDCLRLHFAKPKDKQ
jgi:hypothetical protein